VALQGKNVVVVMPAYNAAKTLADTVGLIPPALVDHLVLVDDGSRDATVEIARGLGLNVVQHFHNTGYGANQKTCYSTALQLGADVVVMLHPDGQYDPRLIPDLLQPIVDGRADIVLGSRMMLPGGAKAGGMPAWKRTVNRLLTRVENAALQAQLSEAHTGYRAYSRGFLETVPWRRNDDGFVFDTQVIFQAHAFGQRLVEVPIRTVYEQDSSNISLSHSVEYGLKTLGVAARYALWRRTGMSARLFGSRESSAVESRRRAA
jgi:glycosyltransferase involved in cell wall biosynthesis